MECGKFPEEEEWGQLRIVGFYHKSNGKLLKRFKEESDMVKSTLLLIMYGSCETDCAIHQNSIIKANSAVDEELKINH